MNTTTISPRLNTQAATQRRRPRCAGLIALTLTCYQYLLFTHPPQPGPNNFGRLRYVPEPASMFV